MSKTEQLAKLVAVREVTDKLIDTVNSQKPTKAQLAELKQALKDAPVLVAMLGDTSIQLRNKIIESIGPGQTGLHLVMRARADQLAQELGTEQASPLEQMLIEQVVIAWLRWQSVEWNYQSNFAQSITLTKGIYFEKRLTAAQQRYLRAAESLARVRGLLRRVPVQVNIAQRQMVQNG